MDIFNPQVTLGIPVRSLQTFLREISYADERIPKVIPDGVYGKQTQDAVKAYQRANGMDETGDVNNDTWDMIVDDYRKALNKNQDARKVHIFPYPHFKIMPGEESIHLFTMQAMLHALAHEIKNIEDLLINGIHDEPSVKSVQSVQTIYGLEPTGIVDKNFYEALSRLYEAYISRNNPAMAAPPNTVQSEE